MDSILETLSHDHRRCDVLLAEAEQAVSEQAWALAAQRFADFLTAMEQHFSREEELLFPAVEARMGAGFGPTAVMRMEHEDMRALLRDMAMAFEGRDVDGYLGSSETLIILMQQHNAKEEQVLYPMADQLLADTRDDLLTAMTPRASSSA